MKRASPPVGSLPDPQARRLAGLRLALVLLTVTQGCRAGPGGWDVAAAGAASNPVVAADLEMIADLRPFPALRVSDSVNASGSVMFASKSAEVELLACRFDLDRTLRVVIDVAPERADWARRAVASVLGGIDGLRFEMRLAADPPIEATSVGSAAPTRTEPAAPVAGRGEIRIADYHGPAEKGPRGAGDTLVVCAGEASAGVLRGEILSAEIRMRTSVRGVIDEVQILDAATWTGALVHELGHALGFQGHPRDGDSILVLEQDRLRRAGRWALAGDVWEDPILAALYRVEIGRSLGDRVLSVSSRSWVHAIEQRRLAVGDAIGPARANVGDRDAQLVWQEAGGLRLRLVFPSWREQLARGKPLIAMPSYVTRRRVELN